MRACKSMMDDILLSAEIVSKVTRLAIISLFASRDSGVGRYTWKTCDNKFYASWSFLISAFATAGFLAGSSYQILCKNMVPGAIKAPLEGSGSQSTSTNGSPEMFADGCGGCAGNPIADFATRKAAAVINVVDHK